MQFMWASVGCCAQELASLLLSSFSPGSALLLHVMLFVEALRCLTSGAWLPAGLHEVWSGAHRPALQVV